MQAGLRFAIQIRANHAEKPGGDIALAKAFRNRIIQSGLEAQFAVSPQQVREQSANVVLAFNMDRPFELLGVCKVARDIGARVALYSLHHPGDGVRAYLKAGAGGARSMIARVCSFDPARYFYAMAVMRGMTRRNLPALKYLLKNRQALGNDIGSMIDDLLVSGRSERAEILADSPALSVVPSWVVPHPLAAPDAPIPAGNPFKGHAGRRHFLIAGRIESRKNQLSVLQVARLYPDDEFVFAGQPNETEPGYRKKFVSLLSMSPNCRQVGQLDFGALLQHIAFADAVISPSWFEVMSLINLYAFALDTPIIASRHTFDGDLIKEGVTRYDPADSCGLQSALSNFRSGVAGSDRGQPGCSLKFKQFLEESWRGFDVYLKALVTASSSR